MFEVGDQTANLLLSIALFAILGLALLTLVPWSKLGLAAQGRVMRWAWLPAIILATGYEWLMPSHMNIRIDLLLLLPAYMIIVVTCLVRWWLSRSRHPEVSNRE